jgi:hypothetical protein
MLKMKLFRIISLTALITFVGFHTDLLAQGETQSVASFRKTFAFELPPVDVSGDIEHPVEPVVDTLPTGPAQVNIIFDPRMQDLLNMHISQNDALVKGPGYRVQIYAGSRLEFANETKADFIQAFGDMDYSIYQKWQPPHFRVRVGDFLTREEAMREMAGFRQVFPDAFIVEDEINLPKYKKQVVLPEDDTDGEESPRGPETSEN